MYQLPVVLYTSTAWNENYCFFYVHFSSGWHGDCVAFMVLNPIPVLPFAVMVSVCVCVCWYNFIYVRVCSVQGAGV